MIIRVNGEEKIFTKHITTISELLAALGAQPLRVAVEINGAITDPSLFDKIPIQDRDHVEIVSFVGGG